MNLRSYIHINTIPYAKDSAFYIHLNAILYGNDSELV